MSRKGIICLYNRQMISMANFEELLLIPFMRIFFYAMIGILGVMIGSFLNVVIYRIPRKEEFVKTPSHCMSCNHKLAWYDNIPLLSWITLGGKCRYCKTKLSAQYPIIEAVNGLMWLSIFFIHGLNVDSVLISLMSSALLALSVIDWRTYEIENGFHFYFAALAIIRIALNPSNWVSHLIGFFCVSLFLFAIFMFSGGRAIGGGDVKLMAACGLFLGWQNIVLALMIGCIVGSIIHLLRMKLSGAGQVLAMGPYLAIGILSSALFGDQLIQWYLSYLGA